MATQILHSESVAATAETRRANDYGFAPDMLAAISRQNFAGCQPFAGTMRGAAPPHFEEAAAILLALGKGFEARAESPLMPGQ